MVVLPASGWLMMAKVRLLSDFLIVLFQRYDSCCFS